MNSDCSDTVFCNGQERCAPNDADADDRGCSAGDPQPCGSEFVCDEAADTCSVDCSTPDPDGDGHDSVACGGDDCDDRDADRFPGNSETCSDGQGGTHDEDCDPDTYGELDADGDKEVSATCCNASADGMNCGPDCDDGDRARRAGQLEICDAVDNDCDDVVDEATTSVNWYVDADGDGFGAPGAAIQSCTPIVGRSLLASDCDDMNTTRNPAQDEVCDLAENNCNGLTDEQPYCDAIVLVGPTGGVLRTTSSSGGAVNVSVPAGALPFTVPLSIGEFHPRSLPALADGQHFIGLPVAITPFGTWFGLPVTITLPAPGDDLIVLGLDGPNDTTWQHLEASIVDGRATFTIRRGGIFVVATRTCLGQACCPGQCPVDMGVPPVDMGMPPTDTGLPPTDMGLPPTDMGDGSTDMGLPPTDMGGGSLYVVIDETFDGASLPSMFEHWATYANPSVSDGQLTCSGAHCAVRSQFVKTPAIFEWRGAISNSTSSFPGFWMYRDPVGTHLPSTLFGGIGLRAGWNLFALEVNSHYFTAAGTPQYIGYSTGVPETSTYDFRVELRDGFQSVSVDGVEVYQSTAHTLPDGTLVNWVLWHRYANGVSNAEYLRVSSADPGLYGYAVGWPY